MSPQATTIKLKSRDDHVFIIDMNVAKQFKIIKHLIDSYVTGEQAGTNRESDPKVNENSFESVEMKDAHEDDEPIFIPNLDGHILGMMIEWAEHHQYDIAIPALPSFKMRLSQAVNGELNSCPYEKDVDPYIRRSVSYEQEDAWDEQLFAIIEPSVLYQLIIAADYLQVDKLYESALKELCYSLKARMRTTEDGGNTTSRALMNQFNTIFHLECDLDNKEAQETWQALMRHIWCNSDLEAHRERLSSHNSSFQFTKPDESREDKVEPKKKRRKRRTIVRH